MVEKHSVRGGKGDGGKLREGERLTGWRLEVDDGKRARGAALALGRMGASSVR